ncbi:MAG: TolC family protein [Prolixibacteraceae bacterium]|nr:TolC family protein [Prolixibacteraceae bacterium]
MKYHLLTISLLLSGILLQGQEVIKLSLNEAQAYAIEHNRTLESARLDIQSSDAKIKESISQGLPKIDASVDWMTYFGYEMEFNLGMGGDVNFTPEQMAEAWNNTSTEYPDVSMQDLRIYQAGSYFEQQLTSMLPASTIKMTDASTAAVQLGQLIFSGQYWAGIKAAKLGKKLTEQGFENSILDIKESVTNSYLMALVTKKSIETINASIENLETVKHHTEMMYKTGIAEQTDVDQLSIQVTMLENNLRSMQRGLTMTYSMLKFQLGLDSDQNIELSSTLDEITSELEPQQSLPTFDPTGNILYQLTQSQSDLSEKMLDIEKWSYAPTITGFYTYNQKLLTTGFDMTPKHLAGVTVSIPIFSSGGRKHKVTQAQIELDKARINQQMVIQQLEIQEKQLASDLKSAIENHEAQKENVEIARRVYQNIEKKYQQGIVSSLELTQTNSNYLQAESNYIQSLMTLLQAKVAIDKLYNQL